MNPKLSFPPFETFLREKALVRSTQRASQVRIADLKINPEGSIQATALGENRYQISIVFSTKKVISAKCSCPYDLGGPCKHIIQAVVQSDEQVATYYRVSEPKAIENLLETFDDGTLLLKSTWEDLTASTLDELSVQVNRSQWYAPFLYAWGEGSYLYEKVHARFSYQQEEHTISIQKNSEGLFLHCDCDTPKTGLCTHLAAALNKRNTPWFELITNRSIRDEQLQKVAISFGFQDTSTDLEDLFHFQMQHGRLLLVPKMNFLKVNEVALEASKNAILRHGKLPWESNSDPTKDILVASYNRYHGNFQLELMRAKVAKNGTLKSPIVSLDGSEVIKLAENVADFPYFQALARIPHTFIPHVNETEFEDAFAMYREVFKAPDKFPLYLYDEDGGKVTPTKLKPISIKSVAVYPKIEVTQKNDFYEVTCKFEFDNRNLSSQSFKLIADLLVRYDKQFYFFDSKLAIRLHHYFASNEHRLFIHKAQFDAYREGFLVALENQIPVHYSLVKEAKPTTSKKTKQTLVSDDTEKRVYLTESAEYILITPAISYGDQEIPLFSRRTRYKTLPDGSREEQARNEWLERGFTKLIRSLHPEFQEENGYEFVYLHRHEFMDSGWFLDAFEKLRQEDIQIFGFAQLSKNRLNPNKAKVTTRIASGIDWFDIHTKVQFGNQEVRLQDLQKAILKRSAFVELGDGTQGLLPEEWVQKFGQFFRSAEINDDALRIHKTNFQLIDDLFREEMIDHEVRSSLNKLTEKFANFHSITETHIPKKLKATLRDYQKEGLNWLNFLDEFGFGGCLADDMGLGKTLQIIAYMLRQHEKGRKEPNLVVVPTSLLFNWQNEIKKFAPHLRVLVLSGTKRNTAAVRFENYQVILTTYGTLLSDVELLRQTNFNLIVLDESQAIKNPNSKRYKAARLLRGRQNLVLTGTPIENNTFDLYAQLSFALPGLLGTARSFLELYANPIDKFQDSQRAKELQRRVHPFVLRRTKKQVAKELPEKTEMVIYCEMGSAQQQIYDSYKKEFQARIQGQTDDELRKNSALILQGMIKLRQVCNSPATLGDNEDYGDESAKLEELMSQIQEKKDEHKILVFSQFVGMLDLIRARLEKEEIPFCYLTGETRDRQAQVDRFQNDDQARVFLISLKAGGTGLNLTQADYVFLVDPWWNPAVENQAIDRAYRIGQEKHVIAIRLITPNSIEEKIMELQSRKRELSDELIHTDNAVLKQLNKQDLLELIN